MPLLPQGIVQGRKPFTTFISLPLVITVLFIVGCASTDPGTDVSNVDATVQDELLIEYDLAGLDVQQIIEQLDTMPITDRSNDLIASVRPDELILSDGQQRETSIAIPDDEFYLSIAPYETQTHDCYYHSLTTCVGELQNTEVSVNVEDAGTGETLIDATLTTFDNGFLGLWLPRGIEATLSVDVDGVTASMPISTMKSEDPTCITTLQLLSPADNTATPLERVDEKADQ